MYTKNPSLRVLGGGILLGGFICAIFHGGIDTVQASALLSPLSDAQSSLKISSLSDHVISFVTPSGVLAGQAISVTFPIEYSLGAFSVTHVDLATSSSAACSSFSDVPLATSALGLTWGASQSGQTVTFTSDTDVIPPNRCIQIRIGSTATVGGQGVAYISNPATVGIYGVTLGGSFGDTGTISETILTDDTVLVSGIVSQAFSFSISTTTIYFGILGSTGAKFASSTNALGDTTETIAHTISVSSNAASGFTLSVQGQTLTSQQNQANTISQAGFTPASSTPGTEQFGIRAIESGGGGTLIASSFSSASSYGYSATASTSQVFATGPGSVLTVTYSLYYLANIAAVTESGTYNSNLVYVATANF